MRNTGADPGFFIRGGAKAYVPATHITSAEPNSLSTGVQSPLRALEALKLFNALSCYLDLKTADPILGGARLVAGPPPPRIRHWEWHKASYFFIYFFNSTAIQNGAEFREETFGVNSQWWWTNFPKRLSHCICARPFQSWRHLPWIHWLALHRHHPWKHHTQWANLRGDCQSWDQWHWIQHWAWSASGDKFRQDVWSESEHSRQFCLSGSLLKTWIMNPLHSRHLFDHLSLLTRIY